MCRLIFIGILSLPAVLMKQGVSQIVILISVDAIENNDTEEQFYRFVHLKHQMKISHRAIYCILPISLSLALWVDHFIEIWVFKGVGRCVYLSLATERKCIAWIMLRMLSSCCVMTFVNENLLFFKKKLWKFKRVYFDFMHLIVTEQSNVI